MINTNSATEILGEHKPSNIRDPKKELKINQRKIDVSGNQSPTSSRESEAKMLFECEQRLGLERLASAISRKSRNMDKKCEKMLNESIACFDRAMRIMQKIGNSEAELFGALVKYSAVSFMEDFLRENYPTATLLSAQCSKISRSVLLQYNIDGNPNLPDINLYVERFETDKFSNLLRGSDIDDQGSRTVTIPVNNELYLKVIYSEKPASKIITEEIDSHEPSNELVNA